MNAFTDALDQTNTQYYTRRLGALRKERSSFVSHWKDLSEFLLPRRGRFLTSDRNKGSKKNGSILDNTATRAVRTLASGMMAGISSPARPWFRLSTPDPLLAKRKSVKMWLDDVEKLLYEIFNRSNLYNVLPSIYAELGVFGTASLHVAKDFHDVVRFYPYSVGQYFIANNERLMVDTNYREMAMSVSQIVGKFGLENTSQKVKDQFNKGNFDQWIEIVHALEPNQNYKPDRVFSRNHRYRSVYLEKGINENKFLNETGFKTFPNLTPRWDVTGEDVYGTDCPGMLSLGDTRQLQSEQREKSKGIAKKANPPLNAPSGMKKTGVNSLPGGVNYYDAQTGREGGVTSVYDIRLELEEMRLDIRDVQERINSAFYVDLFQMIAQMDGVQPRNELEILERKEEKLILLGPVLENLHNEMFDPLIDRVFNIAVEAGIIPDAPKELEGQELRVEYISMLAQAQKAVGMGAIERTIAFIGNVAGIDPKAVHKLKTFGSIDEYAELQGTASKIINTDEEANKIVEAEAQAQQAAQQQVDTAQAIDGAKQLSETDTAGQNALTDILGIGTA